MSTFTMTVPEKLRDIADGLRRGVSAYSEAEFLESLAARLERPAVDGWQPIETMPRDGTTVLMAHWFKDDSPDGYHGGDRFAWIVSGSVDDEGRFWCDFTDDTFDSQYFHTATHWMRPAENPTA